MVISSGAVLNDARIIQISGRATIRTTSAIVRYDAVAAAHRLRGASGPGAAGRSGLSSVTVMTSPRWRSSMP